MIVTESFSFILGVSYISLFVLVATLLFICYSGYKIMNSRNKVPSLQDSFHLLEHLPFSFFSSKLAVMFV